MNLTNFYTGSSDGKSTPELFVSVYFSTLYTISFRTIHYHLIPFDIQ